MNAPDHTKQPKSNRWLVGVMLVAAGVLVLSLAALNGVFDRSSAADDPAPPPLDGGVLPTTPVSYGPVLVEKRFVKEGIEVEFSVRLVREPEQRDQPVLREGDDVLFRFRIVDTASGTPLTGAYPAAWMDLLDEPPPQNLSDEERQKICVRKAEKFVTGGLFSQAELDLNVYYALALNEDKTINVVDPLFGFGGSKLLAMIDLGGRGEDWAISGDHAQVFVTVPSTRQLAVIETATWQVSQSITLAATPRRVALQPDQRYVWVTDDGQEDDGRPSGVTVLNTDDHGQVARFTTGHGGHEVAFSDDSRFAFVTNETDGTLSIVDIGQLQEIKVIDCGRQPVSVAYSELAGMAYVSHDDGTIVAFDKTRHEILARMKKSSGLRQIKFAPGGRYGFVLNPKADLVHIIDASSNRIVQTGKLLAGPEQVCFSDELAYVRYRDTATVTMIPLDQIGRSGQPIPTVEFPGGRQAPGDGAAPSPADAIIQAPGAGAILVANPADQSVYFYKEGMAAPMGEFNNYRRQPRAVLVVDRSLRERHAPGVYETVAKIRRPGAYDMVFFMDAPRIIHCFDLTVQPDPRLLGKNNAGKVNVSLVGQNRVLTVGQSTHLRFRLEEEDSGQPKTGLNDVIAQTFLPPGVWHKRHFVNEVEAGVYGFDFTPPRPGVYYLNVAIPSAGRTLSDSHPLFLRVADAPPESGVATVEPQGAKQPAEPAVQDN